MKTRHAGIPVRLTRTGFPSLLIARLNTEPIKMPVLFFAKVLFSIALVAVVTATATSSPSAAAKPGDWRVFDTIELRSAKLEKFKKWTDVLKRYEAEEPEELQKCTITAAQKCHLAKWRIFLKKISERPELEQLALVNAYLNKWLYVLDPVNYGEKDYWATPKQFLHRSGDCEDYAIAKMKSLQHLGLPSDRMRILVLQDLNLKVGHAVLLVEYKGKVLVLDNQISKVIEQSRIKHYKPIYSINESAWWLHRS
ncbi:MAG: transglutaminase-like cysteine peptidase [Alphaproteobacteria bacterium]